MKIPQRWEQSQTFKHDVKWSKYAEDSGQCQRSRTKHLQIYSRMLKTPSANLRD
jgi:hypothetical protein